MSESPRAGPAPSAGTSSWMKAINFILFQVCWVACVWGAAAGYWWLGVTAVALFAIFETSRAPNRRHELAMLASIAILGFVIDSGYVVFGLLRYASPVPFASAAPVWIVALWVSFALTLNRSLSWLQGRDAVAAVCGLVGGPLSYWIAIRAWSAGEFTAPLWVALLVIGVVWAVATPAVFRIARTVAPEQPSDYQ